MAKATKRERRRDGKTEGQTTTQVAPAPGSPSLGLSDEQISQAVHESAVLALAGDPSPPVPAAADVQRGRQGDDTRPYCPKHNCLCQASGTAGAVTHYRCPVAGCETREKRVRPQLKVPAAPQACPQRCCAPTGDRPQVFLEVVPRLSGLAQLHMACPQCGFHVNVPRPQFDAAAAQRARRQTEDLAAR